MPNFLLLALAVGLFFKFCANVLSWVETDGAWFKIAFSHSLLSLEEWVVVSGR